MNLLKISLLSIRRQLTKRLILLFALSIGLTTVLSLVLLMQSQEASIEKQFDEYGANIIVMPKQDNLALSYGGVNISSVVTHSESLVTADADKIYGIPNDKNIRAVSPKLIGAVSVETNSDSYTALLVGVEMDEEKKIKSWWDLDGDFPASESEIIIGWDTSRKMGLSPGDRVTIKDRDLTVSGILHATGSQDDGVLLAHMSVVEDLLERPDQVSLIDVSALCSDCPIDELVRQIREALPYAEVKAIRQVMNQRMAMVAQFNQFAITLAIIIGLLCSALTFFIMTASVAERRKEIGIFRAVGFSGKDILSIIQSESLIISLAAAVVGIILTVAAAFWVIPAITELTVKDIQLSPLLFGAGGISVILLSLLASLGPAFSASHIDPVETISSL